MYHQIRTSLISLSSFSLPRHAALQECGHQRPCKRGVAPDPEVHQRPWGPPETLISTRENKTRAVIVTKGQFKDPFSPGGRAPLLPTSDSWQTVRNSWTTPPGGHWCHIQPLVLPTLLSEGVISDHQGAMCFLLSGLTRPTDLRLCPPSDQFGSSKKDLSQWNPPMVKLSSHENTPSKPASF